MSGLQRIRVVVQGVADAVYSCNDITVVQDISSAVCPMWA